MADVAFNVTIRGTGGKTITQMLNSYGKSFESLGPDVIADLAKRTKTSLVLRSPKDTGKLRDSIDTTGEGTRHIEISIGTGLPRPYAAAQGLGFTPHWVNANSNPELNMWLKRHGYHAGRNGMVYVTKFKPFVLETMNYYLTPQLITQVTDTHVKRAMNKAGKT